MKGVASNSERGIPSPKSYCFNKREFVIATMEVLCICKQCATGSFKTLTLSFHARWTYCQPSKKPGTSFIVCSGKIINRYWCRAWHIWVLYSFQMYSLYMQLILKTILKSLSNCILRKQHTYEILEFLKECLDWVPCMVFGSKYHWTWLFE